MELLIRALVWLYRRILRRYPSRFRREYGDEMATAFEWELRTKGREAGLAGVASTLWRTGLDWARPLPTLTVGAGRGPSQTTMTMKTRGLGMWGDFVVDLRLAVRNMVRTPVQGGVLVLTLALGIGATTAIFSVLQGVLLAPLPYEEPEELMALRHRVEVEGVSRLVGPGGLDLLDYMQGAPSIDRLGAVQTLESNLNDDQGAARITMGWTTPDFFQMLGARAQVGRVLEPSDWAGADRARMEDPDFQPPPMAAVLGHGLWASRFGGDPGVLGQSIRLNGQSMTVVGVLPDDFRLLLPADAQVPPVIDAFVLMPVPLSDMGRGGGGLSTVVRLNDGVGFEQARAEFENVVASMREDHEIHARLGSEVVLTPLHTEVVGPARAFVWVLFGAVGLLLVIACINVANLLLVRSGARETEFAVRSALGVSRGRLVRQLLTEGLVLAAAGLVVGLALASGAVDLLVSLRPENLPRIDNVSLSGTVLAFSMVLTVGVALLFGLIPALASRGDIARTLVSSRGSGSGSRASRRTRALLIVGEIAVSIVLVAGAGLLFRSFDQLRRVELGIEPEGIVAVDAALPFFGYRADASRVEFYRRLAEEASAIPGVTAAGVVPAVPLERSQSGTWSGAFTPGGEAIENGTAPVVRYRAATGGALEALGARIVEGRDLRLGDEVLDGPLPVVVDRRVADLYFPEGALDRTFRVQIAPYTGQGSIQEARVVGVVEPIRYTAPSVEEDPTIFVPYRAYATVDGTVLLRTENAPAEMLAAVREIIAGIDPGVPAFQVRTVQSVVERASSEARYALLLVGIFALSALGLAAVGLYGVISTLVQQRTREIGIRIAHGAGAGDIGRMVVTDGGRLVLLGLVVGLIVAVLAAPLLGSLLFGVDPVDPLTLVASSTLLGAVALTASVLPALRATRVDPVEALRDD